MIRKLCYKHHTAEFDKLPNAMRHLAADWRTVEPCEMCEAEYTAALAALEALLNNRGGHSIRTPYPTMQL